MTEPTDPTQRHDLTESHEVSGPHEARVRDALAARAEAVRPGAPDAEALAAAIAADAAGRRRRSRLAAGAAAAAIVLVAGIAVLASGGDDPAQVITAEDPATTATSADTSAPPTHTAAATTTAPATTSTTVAATTATTAAPTTTSPVTATTAPALPGASTDPRAGSGHGAVPALLSKVRVGCNAGSDRVVFEFLDGAMPSWQVRYVDGPITMDGSGAEVHVAGGAYLSVRFEGAAGHDLSQESVPATYTGPGRVSASCPSVTEVVETGEFEAIYNWTIGVTDARAFVVTTLDGPSRLVVDVAHG